MDTKCQETISISIPAQTSERAENALGALSGDINKELEVIDTVQEIRKRNNTLWCDLLRIALKHAPAETKIVLAAISVNDAEVTRLLKSMSDED